MPTDFWSWAREEPGRLAVVSEEGREFTYGEEGARANQLVHALRDLGLKKGDTFAVLLSNEPAFVEALMAALQAGFQMVPINYHLTGPEVGYILGNSEAKAFIASDHFRGAAIEAIKETGFSPERSFAVGEIPGFNSYEELLARYSVAEPEDRSMGMFMLYTSGTTGKPKGVRRPLIDAAPEGIFSMLGAIGDSIPGMAPGQGVHLVTGPLYHAAPIAFGMLAIQLGQPLVMMNKWSAERTVELMNRYQVSTSHMVATMFHRMLNLPEEVKSQFDPSNLKVIIHGAAPTPPETKRRMIEWWGPVFYEYYGATEGGGTLIDTTEWLAHPGSTGKPFPMVQLHIVGEKGEELPPGEVGEIWIDMGPLGDMLGFEYYKDEKKTQESRKGNWFTLGDVGYLTPENYLYLTDRKKDMVISGGVNIYPAEIEATIILHPAVRDVAVFGVPDPDWGEAVKAVVELEPGYTPSEELTQEILKFAEKSLARYKLPKSIDYTDELPRSITGKLYKRYLRDQYWEAAGRKI